MKIRLLNETKQEIQVALVLSAKAACTAAFLRRGRDLSPAASRLPPGACGLCFAPAGGCAASMLCISLTLRHGG